MNIITAVLETIQDMKPDRIAEMADFMLSRLDQKYVEFDTPNPGVMFIFPDGRLKGDPDTVAGGKQLDRTAIHQDLLDFNYDDDIDEDDNSAGEHPMINRSIATYYNIIIVAPGHYGGTIVVPYNVEPTREQEQRLAEFEQAGYTIEYLDTDPNEDFIDEDED